VHRFSETWERHASLRLRHGDTTVIDEYAAAGRVHDCPDDTTAYRTVLDQYVNAIAAGRSALMLARTHRDVDALNDLARAHAIDTGQVHGPVLADGDIQWRAGDRLRATRNNRTISVAGDFLRNGDQFTVTGIDREGLIVDAFDGRGTTQLPADYIAEHTAYGWATTIDASQGATVDHGTLLARPGLDREHLYVGLTRGRRRNNVVVAQPSTEIDHHSPPRTEADRSAVEVLRETLRTSDAQTAAHTQLPGAEQPQVAAPPTPSEPAGRAPGRRVSAVPDDWTPRPRPAIYRDDDYHQSIHQDIGRDSSRGR
jgi:ATP-dependent exoDNAse (exonuclease V) alpha subunit